MPALQRHHRRSENRNPRHVQHGEAEGIPTDGPRIGRIAGSGHSEATFGRDGKVISNESTSGLFVIYTQIIAYFGGKI